MSMPKQGGKQKLSMIQDFKYIYYYIGIDISSTHTAIVVLNKMGGLVDYILIEPKQKDLRERGQEVVNKCLTYISKYNNEISVIAIESPAFMAKGKVADLAMIVGGVYYGLSNDYSSILVPPTTLKKFFTGNGRAKKKDMLAKCPLDLLTEFTKYYKKIDDLVDAYALALYAMLKKAETLGSPYFRDF